MKLTDLTAHQLKALIDEIVEQKLTEILGDPDEGLELRDDFKERLARSLADAERGVRGIPVEQVAKELGLSAKDDPVLAELWNNEKDAAYDSFPRARKKPKPQRIKDDVCGNGRDWRS